MKAFGVRIEIVGWIRGIVPPDGDGETAVEIAEELTLDALKSSEMRNWSVTTLAVEEELEDD